MDRIEFGELRIGDTARAHLIDVCDTSWASMGPKVEQFEKEWSDLFLYKDSVAVSSGTDACINACLALYDIAGASRGDEVIVPALSFIATSNAVRMAGFTPVFVDIEKETLNIDPSKIEDSITEKTRAIMVVHTMGRPCDMTAIVEIAHKHGLRIIEDACEAHGALHKLKRIGHFGDMTCFSFYVAHLVCCGEGGIVSTNDESIAQVLRSTRSHGRPFDSIYFDHQRAGINSKMNDLEASIGLEGIENFHDTFNTRKHTMIRFRMACLGFEDVVWFSEEEARDFNCPHGFSITAQKEGDIVKVTDCLDRYNIHWKRNFGCIPTQHAAFSDMGYSLGDFPNAEWVGENGIHIGCHQYLSEEDIARVETALNEALVSL
jgi:dTDP-4-amino-4,6-dideoxygalactose transaminase